MKLVVYLLFFIVYFRQIVCPTTIFCSTLCTLGQCTDKSYKDCKSCTTGFAKLNPANNADTCIVNPAISNSTAQKYNPVGVTSDINYNMQGNAFVQQVIVTGASLTGNCKNSGNPVLDYKYYGNLTLGSVLIIDHSGIDDVRFWKLRIRYFVMIINQWKDHSYIITTFATNPALLNVTDQLDQNSFSQDQQVCGGDKKQKIRIVDHQFNYNQTLNFQFSISAKTDNPTSNIWGVKQIVIMARICHPYCTACYGDSNSNCTACNLSVSAMLSGNKCDLTCSVGYGLNTTGPQICIKCVANCTSCLDFDTFCVNCTAGYYLWTDSTNTSVVACRWTCPQHYFKNNTAIPKTCDTCDPICLNCSLIATNCTSCYPNYYFYNNTCYTVCPAQTYGENSTSFWKCENCDPLCTICTGPSTNCTVCETNGTNTSYLLNTTCLKECGSGYFEDTTGGLGPNLCTSCAPQCATCDLNSTYCFSCTPTFYLYNNTCSGACTQPNYFADNFTWACLDCNIYCVGLTTKLYFSNNLKDTLWFDLFFTENLNWTPADIQAFVTVTQNDPIIDLNLHMDITYIVLSPKIYRVEVKPKGYIFIYNSTFTFKTNPLSGVLHQAINGRPFKLTNYDRTSIITWFLIKTPSLSDIQNSIIDSVSKFSDQILQATTSPYIQEIKKAGAFLFLLSGAQATSTSCLVNNIPSQNLYEGVRFWASFVFFDVPQWQQNSDKSKYLVSSPLDKIIQNARLLQQDSKQNRNLFDTNTIQWRFQRTGHTSFFIFDVYINIVLITFCWILLLIGHCCIQHKIKYKQFMGKFYSFTHKVHEVSIFYITLSTLLEWIYFNSTSIERWVSLGICIFCNVYFLAYQLYIYYDMINYPKAKIGNEYYEYYVLKYSSLLKNIRFEQYDPRQSWSMSHWIRPYNYHIFSFYKKFLMMIALPIFYLQAHAQISALIAIQVFEIIRFLLTKPFKSNIRNAIRLGLEICLLGFFGCVLIQGFMVIQIMKNDAATLSEAINLFYKIGWAGFSLVFIFNIGHIIIVIYDIIMGCRTTNKQSMNDARKVYYMQKINTYEQQNQDVPLALLNQWVKLGNLNDRNYELLPDINLRVQLYKIRKVQKGYEIQIRKIFDAFMNIEFNYQKEMNLTAGKKIQKQITLRKQISPDFYNLIDELYNKYNAKMDFQYMTIKTFQKVIQSNLQPGQNVPIITQQLFQRIELQTFAGQSKIINLQKLLIGFPIKREQLIHLI